jgi:SAM-dependent methyltransferase
MRAGSEARSRARAEAEAAIEAASLEFERGVIDETIWHRRVTGALAAAYLLEDDPRWQSGFDGDPGLWREARELVLEGVSGDGTFLDVGCATGHLIECLAVWARERGQRLSMYGLELNHDLASAARRRLQAWPERIFAGNAVDWEPPMKFTYVRTGLEYVPAERRQHLVARLLRDVVEPGGRLIVGPVSDGDLQGAVDALADAGLTTRYVIWVERQRSA